MTHGISELQLSLLAIGVLSVGGVWGYNVWQERKHRKAAQEVFRGEQRDVLMRQAPADAAAAHSVAAEAAAPLGERIEPVFIAPEEDAAAGAVAREVAEPLDQPFDQPLEPPVAEERLEPGVGTHVEAHVEPHADAKPAAAEESEVPVLDAVVESGPPTELADDIIDCVVHLNAPELVSAPLFWAAQRQILSRLANRIVWSGLDENSGRWQRLHANDANSYRHLVAALQLADRNGPVAADDLALYCDGVRQLAAHYQAQVIVPVVADVLVRARSLDEFCAGVDWRLSINLVHREGKGLPLAALVQLAEIAGLRPRDKTQKADDGLLHAVDGQGVTVFTLGLLGGQPFGAEEAAQSAAGITLTLDVPRIADGVAAFDRMSQLAHHVVTRLEAVIVDDQRMPLSDEVLAMIRAKIGEFQQKMAANQIPAGGRRALRLYA